MIPKSKHQWKESTVADFKDKTVLVSRSGSGMGRGTHRDCRNQA